MSLALSFSMNCLLASACWATTCLLVILPILDGASLSLGALWLTPLSLRLCLLIPSLRFELDLIAHVLA
jgi:hypothetical protein